MTATVDHAKQAAARRDALAVITALHNDLPDVANTIVSDWLDLPRGTAGPIAPLLAAQLTYWNGLLFSIACRAGHLDAASTSLTCDGEPDQAADRAAAVALTLAALRHDTGSCTELVTRHLASQVPAADAGTFLLVLAQLGSGLLPGTAALLRTTADTLLPHLGVGSAARALGGGA